MSTSKYNNYSFVNPSIIQHQYTIKTLILILLKNHINNVEIVNKPRVSKSILRTYQALNVLTALLIVFFVYLAFFTPAGIVMLGASFVLLTLILPLFIMVIKSLNNTKYVLLDEVILIDTSPIIGGSKRVQYDEIESVERTLIPLGFKLWGVSFHGGYYRIPGLGSAFLAITNMVDGVLIRTKSMNYIISPREPNMFIETLRSRINYIS